MGKTKVEAAAEWVAIDEITPWGDNPRDNDHAVPDVAASIKRFGFASPIIARRENGEVIAGHTRLKAAKALGLDRVPVRYLDLDPTDAHLLALADNKVGEAADWSADLTEVLRELRAAESDLEGLGWSDDELTELLATSDDDGALISDQYTAKIEAPIYEPKGDKPDEADLFDSSTSSALQAEIEAADLPSEVATFLKAAAYRHTVFRYDRIAEYYAHAPAEIQRLMEASALVIIDFDQAIERGFVRLSTELAEAYGDTYAE